MRAAIIFTFALVFGAFFTVAQTPPAFPSGAEARQAQLMKRLGSDTRNWIQKEAAREAGLRDVTETTAKAAIRENSKFGKLAGGDIEALVFIVMMEAAKSAQEDVRTMMGQVKQINDAKAAQRKATTKKAPAVAEARPVKPSPVNQATLSLRPRPKADLDAAVNKAKDNRDSMSEMGEMESLRLQMAMDRLSKMMSTLSNLLKKMSETSAGITQNLK